jgi:hypothetical protein
MDQGRCDYDFMVDEMPTPRIDELISHRGGNYEVKFIQYVIEDNFILGRNTDKVLDHILITGILNN